MDTLSKDNKYKYLLIDIDGTVLNFLAAESAAIKSLFRRFNLGECTDEMIKTYSSINISYWQKLERNEIKKSELLIKRYEDFFAYYHLDITLAKQFNDAYQMALGDTIVFNDDAYNVLLKLKEKYTLIAITNGTKIAQTKKIKVSKLDQVFDEIVISEDVGVEKPNIKFFEYCFSLFNLVNTEECLVVGDSLSSDILGANNAHIDACWYNPKGDELLPGYSIRYEIKNLSELTKLI